MAINPSTVTTAFPVPGRNVYDFSHKVTTDIGFGMILPIDHIDINPFERLEYTPVAAIKTIQPCVNPMYSRARCRIFAFWSPDKNYVPGYLTNAIEDDTPLPAFFNRPYWADDSVLPHEDYVTVQPLSLGNCLGLPIGFTPLAFSNTSGSFNYKGTFMSGHRILTYADVCRNYFFDRNQSNYPIMTYSGYESDTVVRSWDVRNLEDLDEYFENKTWMTGQENNPAYRPLVAPFAGPSANPAMLFANNSTGDNAYLQYFAKYFYTGGICLKPHMPDINSAFVSNNKYEQAIAKSIVRLTTTAAGEEGIAYQDIIDGSKIYNFFNKVLATGGQLDEMIRAEFGVNVTDDLDIPMFLRQWSFDIDFEDVVSSAQLGDGTNQQLGDVASRGIGALTYENEKHARKNRLSFSSKFHGTIAIYAVVEPYVEYYEGIDPFLLKTTTLEKYWPSFDRAGWQPLPLYQLTATHTGSGAASVGNVRRWAADEDPFLNQVGVQPAYTEYKGTTSRLMGHMATTNRGWSFARNYEADDTTFDGEVPQSPFSTYIYPESYNYAFAQVSGEFANPFSLVVGARTIIKRPISRVQLTTVNL